jgi:hypothetical protein
VQARLTKSEKKKLNASEKLIQYMRKNPAYAAKVIFKVELTLFQRLALSQIWFKTFVLILMGRGIGKTWLGALAVCMYAILFPKTKIGIIAPVFRQVGYFFDYIQEFYDSSEIFRACCKQKPQRNMNREYLQFVNGSYIEGLPLGDGNKIRGRRYNFVWVDEYAFVPEDIIKLVIRPFLNIKKKGIDNKLVISSTAFYAWNHFYSQYLFFNAMIRRKPKLFGLVEYTYLDLLKLPDAAYQIDMNILNMSRADSTEEQFDMENLCRFPIGNSGFFTARLIENCTPKRDDGSPIELKGRPDREYVMGVDVARVEAGDDFVIQILRLDGNVKRVVYTKAMNGASYPDMADAIRRCLLDFNIVRLFMDSQGGGMAIYDILCQPWFDHSSNKAMLPIINMEDKEDTRSGIRILKLISGTAPLNSEMFHGLKSEMEHARMLFPITMRRDSSGELEKVNNDINQTKQQLIWLIAKNLGMFFKFEVPTGKKKDRAVALALACLAARDYLTILKSPTPTLCVGMWA